MKYKYLMMILLVVLMAGQVMADQVIFSPTGRTLGLGQAKAEIAINADDSTLKNYWVNVGLPRVELQAIGEETATGETNFGFGAELLVLPETLVTPAIGLGIRDIANDTTKGRAYYVAGSYTVPLTGWTGVTLKLHGGLGADAIDGPFAGVELGLPANLTAYGEWDSEHFNAALGWSPISHVQLKAYWLDGELNYGARLSIGL